MPRLFNKIIFPLFVVCCLLFVFSLMGCGDIDTDTDSTVTTVVVSPSFKTLGVNQTQLFTAIAKNSLGQFVSGATITWTRVGTGSISSAGLYTASSATGEATVYGTASNGISDESTVTITQSGWVAGTVYDSAGYKVQGLKVYLQGHLSTLFDFTNSVGAYSISSVPAGTYEVLTEQTAVYRSASNEATVATGETTTVNFTIEYFTPPVDTDPPESTI